MNVKNLSKVPIEIGHTTIGPNQVADIEEALLYQPRVQALRACGDLLFPFTGEPPVPPAPVEPFQPGRRALDLVTEVPPPVDQVEAIPRSLEDRPKGKRR